MFREHLEVAIARAERTGRGVAVLFLDLDDFKLVNDSFGHGAGDELLRAVALRLGGAVRATDVVARQGGDEFLILLSDLDLDLAARGGSTGAMAITAGVASKLVDSLQAPFAVAGTDVCVTPSIGASLFPADGDSAETLLKHADIAMYTAKDGGATGTASTSRRSATRASSSHSRPSCGRPSGATSSSSTTSPSSTSPSRASSAPKR